MCCRATQAAGHAAHAAPVMASSAAVKLQIEKNKAQVGELVESQTREWTALVQRQMQAEYEMMRSHNHQQLDLLKRLMTELHQQQIGELKEIHERYAVLILRRLTKTQCVTGVTLLNSCLPYFQQHSNTVLLCTSIQYLYP